MPICQLPNLTSYAQVREFLFISDVSVQSFSVHFAKLKKGDNLSIKSMTISVTSLALKRDRVSDHVVIGIAKLAHDYKKTHQREGENTQWKVPLKT